MKVMAWNDEKRCYECGKWIFSGGIFIGDENSEVPTRALCYNCIAIINHLRKENR